jgi:hypothetical protein
MNKHHGRHNDPTHHANILMRGHHAAGGGAAPAAGGYSSMGTMGSNMPHYKKGGASHRKRHRHADGDSCTGVSPITGKRSPDLVMKYKGGRACHAAGDTVAKPYRYGGNPVEANPERHFGQKSAPVKPAEILEHTTQAAEQMHEAPTQEAEHEAPHYETPAQEYHYQEPAHAESAYEPEHEEEYHDYEAPHEEYHEEPHEMGVGSMGGEEHEAEGTYRRGGRAHRHHKRGRSCHAAGDVATLMRGKYRDKRHMPTDGDVSMLMRKGRGKKHMHREHHGIGNHVGSAIGNVLGKFGMSALQKAMASLNTGGPAKPTRLAAGGAGKVRKGMLSKSGKIINKHQVHSPYI